MPFGLEVSCRSRMVSPAPMDEWTECGKVGGCARENIGGLPCCTVPPCERGHVAPTDATGHECSPRSSRSVAGQGDAATGAAVAGRRHGGRLWLGAKQIKTSLPLTTVNRASGLALCVQDLAGRAHLQLSARGGGGRVQSIGGAIRGCGSGHGGTNGARVSSGGWVGICGCGRRSDWRGRKGRRARR
jgi:hypothetical protein